MTGQTCVLTSTGGPATPTSGDDAGKASTTLGIFKSTGDGGNGGKNNAAGNQFTQIAADFTSK